jgi:hypothetical protein
MEIVEMDKATRYEAKVNQTTKDELELLDAEIKLLLLPEKTTKADRIKRGFISLIKDLKGEEQ